MKQLSDIKLKHKKSCKQRTGLQKMIKTALTAGFVFTVGCASNPSSKPLISSENEGLRVEQLMVVDCLLPGQVRQLGSKLTYLTPRRPIKTAASDCEIRGGEYVAFDRSNYATALKIWLPQAKGGDAEAQTYVGEIYEKGLGIQADYKIAAAWYMKAAEQGLSRAQINLGYLYETGLGVQRDLTAAMNWYRKASGLSDGDLEFVSSIEAANRQAKAIDHEKLEAEVEQLRTDLEKTRVQLAARKQTLSAAESKSAALRQQIKQQNRALADAEEAIAKAESAQTVTTVVVGADPELQQKLVRAETEQKRLTNRLAKEQLQKRRLEKDHSRTLAELQQNQSDLENSKLQLVQNKQRLTEQQALLSKSSPDTQQVALLTQTIADLKGSLAAQESRATGLKSQTAEQQAKLQAQVANSTAAENQLQVDLQKRKQEVSLLKNQLATASAANTVQSEQANDEKLKLARAEQEQQRLTGRLAGEQLKKRSLEKEQSILVAALEQSQTELEGSKLQLAAKQTQLDRQQASLSDSSVDTQKLAQLTEKINQLENTISDQTDLTTQLSNQSSSEQAALLAEVEKTRTTEKQLQAELEKRGFEVAQLQQQLAATNTSKDAQLAQADEDLTSARKEQSRLTSKLALQQLASRKQTNIKIAELKIELQQQDKIVVSQRSQLDSLQGQLLSSQARLDTTSATSVVAVVASGPIIEIIDPPLLATRGTPSINLRSAVAEIEIIGRVQSNVDLLSFRINDQSAQLGKNGVFRINQAIKSKSKSITLVAVDQEGQRTALDFVLNAKTGNSNSTMAASAPKYGPKTIKGVDFGNYYALVIGNNNYSKLTNLNTAGNDAKVVAEVLENKYGFNTQLLLDADRYTMLSALNNLRETLTDKDNLLIYYAGHGELDEVNLRGYWLPVDSEPDSSTNWISNVAVTDILNVMSAKHILVVADSCYSGSMTRSSVARLESGMSDDVRKKWYSAMVETKTRAVLTSGGVKPVLDSGGGDHSIFAKAFIDVLNENDTILEGYKLYREVQSRVKSAAAALNVDQEPQYAPIKYAGHEAGEFFLLPGVNSMNTVPKASSLALLGH